MQIDIFAEARKLINESIIKRYFRCEGSFQTGREYFILSPLRHDNNVGSFAINLDTGYYVDNARPDDKGDFIELISRVNRITLKEAAELIVRDNGGIEIEQSNDKKTEKEKVAAVFPIPIDALDKLYQHVQLKNIIEKFGNAEKAWKYIDESGIWMCVVRHRQEDDVKNDIPYYFTIKNSWSAGCPIRTNRPIYNVTELQKARDEGRRLKCLIVEGNKCADIKVDGYILFTWWGGCNQAKLFNWSVFDEYSDVVESIDIWPDYDAQLDKNKKLHPDHEQPGLSVALIIQSKIKMQSKILDVYDWCRANNKPTGYDIADAFEDGIDLIEFIKERKAYERSNVDNNISMDIQNDLSYRGVSDNSSDNRDDQQAEGIDHQPFKFLGYDHKKHYFIADGFDIVYEVPKGQVAKGRLMELAPLSWWLMNFPKNTKSGAETPDWESAADWITQSSRRAGMFSSENIRGAGIWKDSDKYVINNGVKVIDDSGNKVKTDNNFHYVKSSRHTDTYSGEIATRQEGEKLMELFLAQGFESRIAAICALGWTLIAPFGGLLKWRPHIWITGSGGTGKTWVMENLIDALTGQFKITGSGKCTPASIYKDLRTDACPVVLDEMEPTKKSKDSVDNIGEIVEIARNASSNFSARRNIVGADGTVEKYTFRSCFCFASIVPYLQGSAIESRFIPCRLKNLKGKEQLDKIEKSTALMDEGILSDPGKYRRRMFRDIDRIIENTDVIRKALSKKIDQRDADNYAPIFSAIFSLTNDADRCLNADKFVDKILDEINKNKTHEEKDEDKMMHEIFNHKILTDDREQINISELIHICTDDVNCPENMKKLLHRNGIRFYTYKGQKTLAFAVGHNSIKAMLRETVYEQNYKEIMKRHPAIMEGTASIYFAGSNTRAMFMNYDELRKMYFEEKKEEKSDISEGAL